MDRLHQALNREEADAIAYLAYEIRSSAVAFGAKPLARLCLYLEAVKERDWSEARSVMQATQRAFDTLQQDLEKQAGDRVLS
ncbi:MAG: Hpt domain-containing protein [Candidatus Obscuribacter sp.]|nr:Hpt domain-containing protein [Candidatus Obscuribacter sp.]